MISPWQIAFEQNEIIPVCFQLLKIYRNDFDFLKSYRYDFNVLYSKIFSKSYRYDFKKLKSFRYIFNFRNRTEKPFNMTSLAALSTPVHAQLPKGCLFSPLITGTLTLVTNCYTLRVSSLLPQLSPTEH